MTKNLIIILIGLVGSILSNIWMKQAIHRVGAWEINESLRFYQEPILAFEFAQDISQLNLIFESEAKKSAMATSIYWDFLFIVSYVLLMVGIILCALSSRLKIRKFLVGGAVFVGIFDLLENWKLLEILSFYEQGFDQTVSRSLHWMSIFTYSKWVLAVVMSVISILLLLYCLIRIIRRKTTNTRTE